MAGGLTFGAVKDVLRRVADNGICADDPRLMQMVNEATLELMMARDPETKQAIIPVGCMATYDVTAVGTELLLPKELKNAIEVEVLGVKGVRGKVDVRQGWYDLINPFTYVDPNLDHDNPLIDLGLVADVTGEPPSYSSYLRRKYDYPGLEPNAVVRVTGAKAYLPITNDAHFPLIQNVPVLKLMMIAIHHRENNDRDGGKALKADAVEMLVDEIKSFMVDPKQSLKRKAGYEADMAKFAPESFGHIRARLAFELPAGLQRGKSELTRLLEAAEQRLMSKGSYVGTLEEFRATVQEGRMLAPYRVKTILAADLGGQPLDVRNIFFQYLKNGPGRECATMLIDEGEYHDTKSRKRYRQYRLGGDNEMMTRFYPRSTAAAVATQGPPGETGGPGTPGNGLRFGHGVPSNTLGIDGDSYIDLDTYDLYQKTSNVYAVVGNIQGPAGESSMEALTLNLEALTGGGSTRLDGVDVDALGIGLSDARIITIDGESMIYQILEGMPDVNGVAVLNHAGWHWQRTL